MIASITENSDTQMEQAANDKRVEQQASSINHNQQQVTMRLHLHRCLLVCIVRARARVHLCMVVVLGASFVGDEE